MARFKSIDNLLKNREVNVYSLTIFLSFLLYFLLATSFRLFRSLFPIYQNKDIVGFAQYFGYPTFFDTVLFFVLVLIPPIAYFASKRIINVK